MMTNFILAPIIVHLITAILLLFFWQKVSAQRIISIIGNVFAFICCIRLFVATDTYNYLILQVGNWKRLLESYSFLTPLVRLWSCSQPL